MTVHFIGAGPGAPDLITVRGRELIGRCPVCLYAGSLVPKALLDHCPPGARIVDTAPMSLDEIIAQCRRATDEGHDVARLHSGDLSVWSALGEQLRRLDEAGIAYTITPGVPAFAAAAAALGQELTLPELAQSVVLTRTSGRASAIDGRPLVSSTSLEAVRTRPATRSRSATVQATSGTDNRRATSGGPGSVAFSDSVAIASSRSAGSSNRPKAKRTTRSISSADVPRRNPTPATIMASSRATE